MRRASGEGRTVPARIKIQDRNFVGSLSSIANQPEPTSWFSGNVKEYATIVSIDGTPEGLRPGMTAECEILVNDLEDVLFIPVAAVVEQRNEFLCWVEDDAKIEKRPLVLGETNDQFVEVKDGVAEGEKVVLNPRTVVEEARGIREEVEKTDKAKKFGDRAKGGKPGSGGPPAEAGPNAGGAGPTSGGGPGAGGAPGAPGAGGPPSGGQAGGGRMDLMQFDKDKDGKISKDEAPSQMANFFDRMDTDGDGFITKGEVEELRKKYGGGGGGPPQ
jgi:HlyD family secretion protein